MFHEEMFGARILWSECPDVFPEYGRFFFGQVSISRGSAVGGRLDPL